MDIAGIICEFDPFHNGHAYLISKAREQGASGIVCVMSGDFVQRGGPALCDKFARAEAAVKCGADLVLELPAVYAVNSADWFSGGGVRMLNGLGCVDALVFGSECGDADKLLEIARATAFESEEFSSAVKEFLSEGMSYPEAYQKALSEACPDLDASVLNGPNDLLAVCYLREIIRQGSAMVPFAVKRKGAFHGSSGTAERIASASVIRELVSSGSGDWRSYVPEAMQSVLSSPACSAEALRLRNERLFAIVRAAVLLHSDSLAELPEVSEGLENRIVSSVQSAESPADLISRIATDRYKTPRIRRILTQLILGIDRKAVEYADSTGAAYAKILALNGRGAEILKAAKEKGTIPVYSNINKNADPNAPESPVLDIDVRSADMYSIICGRPISECSDKVMVPKVLKL